MVPGSTIRRKSSPVKAVRLRELRTVVDVASGRSAGEMTEGASRRVSGAL
jgi:hypothetical protein